MTATGRRSTDVRTELLNAAVAEITTTGPDRASIRSIARRVGISHQAITHYFADRTALLTAVATQGWQQLHEAVASALAAQQDDGPTPAPGDAVVTIGRTYVQYARTHRPQFQLMFTSSLLHGDQPDLVDAKARMWALHLATVEDARHRGWGSGVPATELAMAAFSLAHGMASLEEHLPAELHAADDVLEIVKSAVVTTRPEPAAVLYAGDLDRMQAFYCGCLAMTVTESADGYRVLRSTALRLKLVQSAEALPGTTPAPRRSHTAVKLAFPVDSIASARALVTDFGGTADPACTEWTLHGATHCDVVDTEGNVVQLIEAGTEQHDPSQS